MDQDDMQQRVRRLTDLDEEIEWLMAWENEKGRQLAMLKARQQDELAEDSAFERLEKEAQ